jgi:hypothetical protein
MESVKEYAQRHRVSKQRVNIWIHRGLLIAEKKAGAWILLGLQARPSLKNGRPTADNGISLKFGIVKQWSKEGTLIKNYASAKEASKAMNTSQSNICKAMNNHKASACGYRWTREIFEKDN